MTSLGLPCLFFLYFSGWHKRKTCCLFVIVLLFCGTHSFCLITFSSDFKLPTQVKIWFLLLWCCRFSIFALSLLNSSVGKTVFCSLTISEYSPQLHPLFFTQQYPNTPSAVWEWPHILWPPCYYVVKKKKKNPIIHVIASNSKSEILQLWSKKLVNSQELDHTLACGIDPPHLCYTWLRLSVNLELC